MALELQKKLPKNKESDVADRDRQRRVALAALEELKKLREDLPPIDAVQIVREGRDSAKRNVPL